MTRVRSPSDTPNAGALAGFGTALVGLAGGVAIYRQPESLMVPLWLGLVACACFVLSGIALALKTTRYTRLYQWSVVALLVCMGCLPAWFAFAGGIAKCTASLPLLDGPLGCKIAFGIATLVMLPILMLAVRQAIRKPAA